MTPVEALWKEANEARDPRAALKALDELLRLEPRHSQALNFAGWLRTLSPAVEGSDETALGLIQLREALETGDPDPRIPVNLADALGLRGRGAEAIPRLRAWLSKHPKQPTVWNSLGWLLGVLGNDDAGAVEALNQAIALNRWLSATHLNLARVHLKSQRIELGEHALLNALRAHEPHRPHEGWLLLGEVHRSRGHLRRALGAYRRSFELDPGGELKAQVEPRIAAVAGALQQAGKYFLHAVEDSLRAQAWQSGSIDWSLPITLRELSRFAEAARFQVPEDAALQLIAKVCDTARLPADSADRSAAVELEQLGVSPELVSAWRATQLALYGELLALEEPSPLLDERERKLTAAAARRDWPAATALLASMAGERDPDPALVLAAGESLGDAAWRVGDVEVARSAWERALGAAQRFASWASAGGEGLARMVAVNRLKSKLDPQGVGTRVK